MLAVNSLFILVGIFENYYMPIFEYSALGRTGKKLKGSIDADSLRQARSKLRSQNIFPTDLVESGKEIAFNPSDVTKYFQRNSISQKELALTTRQLATLVNAGLPLVMAISSTAEQIESESIRRIMVTVREEVERGNSLSNAMENFPKAFPRLYVSMIASGEASGTLDTVLLNLADHLESQVELMGRVKAALMYPMAMLIICFLVIMGLFVFLVPKITDIFIKQGARLPLTTQITLFISNFLVAYWWLVIVAMIGAFILLGWYYRQESGRQIIDRLMLKIPIFSPIYQKIYTARIAQTLSSLLNSGVQLLTAMEICQKIVANVHIVKALETAREGVREGKSLAAELKKTGFFPTMLVQMMAVGEKSGELESMLKKAGTAYQNEANATLGGLTRILELLMIIIVGVIVLWVVLSVLMPMVDLIDLVQGK